MFVAYPKRFAVTLKPPSGEGLPAYRSLGPRGSGGRRKRLNFYVFFVQDSGGE